MDINNTLIFIGCVIGIIVLGIFFKIKVWKIIKLVINSILGGLLIFLINQFGSSFGLHIGLNIATAVFVGIFGIPGVALLILLKIF